MEILARPYTGADSRAWDALVAGAWNGTFLHTRRFLGYHKERFTDASLILEDATGRLLGVLPAAVDPAIPSRIVSHPGITYGGIVHDGRLRGGRMVEALSRAAECLHDRGFEMLLYKPVPTIYHRVPAGDDLFALHRLGARRCRCQLSAAVDLAHRPVSSERRRRAVKVAERAQVRVDQGVDLLQAFWPVLEENLRRKHAAKPVHSLDEMVLLRELFPAEISCIVAWLGEQVAAGVVVFSSLLVDHLQYIASDADVSKSRALDLVIERSISNATEQGRRYLDLGTSNQPGTWELNEGLYEFKAEFGAGGVVHELYEMALS